MKGNIFTNLAVLTLPMAPWAIVQATDCLMNRTVGDTQPLNKSTAVCAGRFSLRTVMVALPHCCLSETISRVDFGRRIGEVWSSVEMFDGTYREMLLLVNLFFGLAAGMEMERAELEII
jgi:hypothetical protein